MLEDSRPLGVIKDLQLQCRDVERWRDVAPSLMGNKLDRATLCEPMKEQSQRTTSHPQIWRGNRCLQGDAGPKRLLTWGSSLQPGKRKLEMWQTDEAIGMFPPFAGVSTKDITRLSQRQWCSFWCWTFSPPLREERFNLQGKSYLRPVSLGHWWSTTTTGGGPYSSQT